MTTARAFIAIELPDWLHDRLAEIQDQLEADGPPGAMRWVRVESVHLTLKFLGDVPLKQIPDIEAGLARAAVTVAPFEFDVERLGCFPDTRRPNNVWVGVNEPTGALTRRRGAPSAHT
jgi:2'-5' RNA ligase